MNSPSLTSEKEPQNEVLAPYFMNARPELLNVIPVDARRILEIGCGAGQLGAALKLRQQSHVTGIDMNTDAINFAAKHIDVAIATDIEVFDFPWEDESFDCIIAGDILEHLKDPWKMLSCARRLLASGGTIVVSIPNVSNLEIIYQISEGLWNYTDAGLLDRTHLRFFTKTTFLSALISSGFKVRNLIPLLSAQYGDLPETVRTAGGPVSFGNVSINLRDANHVLDIFTYQWLFLAG